jgi:hypothetical protein
MSGFRGISYVLTDGVSEAKLGLSRPMGLMRDCVGNDAFDRGVAL